MRLLSERDIRTALPMPEAVGVMARAFCAISTGQAAVAERQPLPLANGTGLLMGAAEAGVGLCAKLVSVMPGNPALGLPGTIGALLLADDATGRPLALLEGTALTAWRTAAASACAIDVLARPEARQALLIGCGTQAATQLLGMDAVRQLDCIQVHGLEPARVDAFVEAHRDAVRARLETVTDLTAAVAAADIVVTVTTAERPVFDIDHLAAGAHVSGIGSFRRGMCEIDPALAEHAAVFVESRQTAGQEAGELVAAREANMTSPAAWAELGEVLAGERPGRADASQLTYFKSVGHALFDLHAARAVYDRAEAAGLGQAWTP